MCHCATIIFRHTQRLTCSPWSFLRITEALRGVQSAAAFHGRMVPDGHRSCPPFVWDMTGTSPTKRVFLADFLTLCGFGDQVMGYQWNFWSVWGNISIPKWSKCGSSAHDSCGGLKCGERSTPFVLGPPCRFLSHFVCFPWTPLSPAEECCYRRQLAHEEQSRTPREVFWGGPVTLEAERPSK